MTNLPVTGKFTVTATYGQTGRYWISGHKGIDIVCNNHDIYATCDGTVRVVAYDSGGWGHYVSIGDSEGRRHIFCHMQSGSIRVSVGQKVNRSTVIGTMGATGNVSGLHLHYQINNAANTPVDPTPYMGIPNKQGTYNSKDYELSREDTAMYKDESNIASWAKDAVKRVTDAGLMKGDEKGNFNPKSNLTRQEAAVILDRLLNKNK